MKVSGKIGSSGALVSDSVEKRFEPEIHTYILTVVIVGNLIKCQLAREQIYNYRCDVMTHCEMHLQLPKTMLFHSQGFEPRPVLVGCVVVKMAL